MALLKDVMAYIADKYPHKDELSNARLTKMVYLADWKHSLDNGSQITEVKWYFDNYGPFVWDVYHAAKEHPDVFTIEHTANYFGGSKVLIGAKRGVAEHAELSSTERAAADHIIEMTQPLSWDAFIKLVYSTYPIMASERYSTLDLPGLANSYRNSPLSGAAK